jgi:hypothetical protein
MMLQRHHFVYLPNLVEARNEELQDGRAREAHRCVLQW